MCALSHEKEANYELSRIRIAKNDELGLSSPLPCRQCQKAPCMEVCPVEAIVVDAKTGAKVINYEDCVVCESCLEACPFGSISGVEKNGERKVIKCDLCGGDPLCVKHCETGAIKFMESEDLGKEKAYSMGDTLLTVIKEAKGIIQGV